MISAPPERKEKKEGRVREYKRRLDIQLSTITPLSIQVSWCSLFQKARCGERAADAIGPTNEEGDRSTAVQLPAFLAPSHDTLEDESALTFWTRLYEKE